MKTIEGFLLYRIEGHPRGLAINEAVKNAVDILPYTACALAAGRDPAFIRAEMAMNFIARALLVIAGFFHPVRNLILSR